MKLSRFKEIFTTKMRNRYRLIIRNDRNLAERISITLTPLNVILLLSGLLVFFSAIAIFLLPMTPIRYIMPGGGDINPRDFAVLQQRLDSIERLLELKEKRDSNLYKILKGDESENDSSQEVSWYRKTNRDFGNVGLWSFFSQAYAESGVPVKDTTAPVVINSAAKAKPNGSVYTFFPPLKGVVTDTFSYRNNHTAVDVVSYTNAAVKATLDGTVVLSSWTPETGHVMLIQHTDNLISVYKHNSVLLKQQGARVRAGEVIALVGNSGELTTGPHLHFELWQNGEAVDPLDYIKF